MKSKLIVLGLVMVFIVIDVLLIFALQYVPQPKCFKGFASVAVFTVVFASFFSGFFLIKRKDLLNFYCKLGTLFAFGSIVAFSYKITSSNESAFSIIMIVPMAFAATIIWFVWLFGLELGANAVGSKTYQKEFDPVLTAVFFLDIVASIYYAAVPLGVLSFTNTSFFKSIVFNVLLFSVSFALREATVYVKTKWISA